MCPLCWCQLIIISQILLLMCEHLVVCAFSHTLHHKEQSIRTGFLKFMAADITGTLVSHGKVLCLTILPLHPHIQRILTLLLLHSSNTPPLDGHSQSTEHSNPYVICNNIRYRLGQSLWLMMPSSGHSTLSDYKMKSFSGNTPAVK